MAKKPVRNNKKTRVTTNKQSSKDKLPSLRNETGADASPDTRPSVSAVVTAASKAAAPQTVTEDAMFTAERILKSATFFHELYARYNAVRELAKQLNGLPQSSPLPAAVKIDKIEFSFTIGEQAHVVSMAEVKTAGEIAPILASTLSTCMEKMYQEIFSLNNISTAMQRAIETAIVKPTTANNQTTTHEQKG